MTGQLEEEKMQVYVRLGIRLLYKVITYALAIGVCVLTIRQGARGKMEGARGMHL